MTDGTQPAWTPFDALPFAHGGPIGYGRLRSCPSDFQVDEELGFAPDGDGDHRLLWVRKTGANTEWVARRLAKLAGVSVSTVGYAGLKDRHAVTSQWFSLPRPRDTEPDWSELRPDGIEVLEVRPHRRKLRQGALAGNRFRILIRDLDAPPGAVYGRVAALRERGVPNYFGEQRFGRGASNLVGAEALFSGERRRVPPHQRGLWLSAARSQLFNEVLAERVRRGDWDRPQPGDCLQLDGSRSFFVAAEIDDVLLARAEAMDLHPSGPLWGAGSLSPAGDIRTLEAGVAARFPAWAEGLVAFGMEQQRRSLRLPVSGLGATELPDGLELRFALPAGSYATAVLRELVDWGRDVAGAGPSE